MVSVGATIRVTNVREDFAVLADVAAVARDESTNVVVRVETSNDGSGNGNSFGAADRFGDGFVERTVDGSVDRSADAVDVGRFETGTVARGRLVDALRVVVRFAPIASGAVGPTKGTPTDTATATTQALLNRIE